MVKSTLVGHLDCLQYNTVVTHTVIVLIWSHNTGKTDNRIVTIWSPS